MQRVDVRRKLYQAMKADLKPGYLDIPSDIGLQRSFSEARSAEISPGAAIWERDIGLLAPEAARARSATRGKWHWRDYELSGGKRGSLIMVNDLAKDEGEKAVPPEFEVKLDFPGWYAIWLGIPRFEEPLPLAWRENGVDVALDSDEAYVNIRAERGRRKYPERGITTQRIMGPMNVEVMCYWKCAKLDGRRLRVRIPNGTFQVYPWGLVQACLSSICLVRLNDKQVEEWRRDTANPETKRVIIVNDGAGHFYYAEPGRDPDGRFVEAYRDSDVKMLFFQTGPTSSVNYPSKVASMSGDMVPEEHWALLPLKVARRRCDYIRWAAQHGQDSFTVLSRLCRRAGMEFHASLRLNRFSPPGGHFGMAMHEISNGKWWFDHPELRKRSGGPQVDYAKPEVRKFILDILMELASFDVTGINLDFTRWPPIADIQYHDYNVLTSFIMEVRQALDRLEQAKSCKRVLSASVVDGYHARVKDRLLTLADQKIDLEAWLASGALDFICVQAWDHAEYIKMAKRHKVPYYAVVDNCPIDAPGGSRLHPHWKGKEDPLPGEDAMDCPPFNSHLDPTEYDQFALRAYRAGADGVCLHNCYEGWKSSGRLGHIGEIAERVKSGAIFGQEMATPMKILPT